MTEIENIHRNNKNGNIKIEYKIVGHASVVSQYHVTIQARVFLRGIRVITDSRIKFTPYTAISFIDFLKKCQIIVFCIDLSKNKSH